MIDLSFLFSPMATQPSVAGASSLLNLVLLSLGLLGIAGGVVAFLLDRTNKERLAGLRGDVADLRSRNEDKDKIIDDQEEKITQQSKIIARHEGEINSLTKVINAQAGPLKEMRDEMRALITAHHDTAVNGFAMLEKQSADLLRIHGDRRFTDVENVTRQIEDSTG